jgi:uncharacterized membrane protein YkvA (DUF1232 family)
MDKTKSLWLKVLIGLAVVGCVWYIFTPNDLIPEGVFGPLNIVGGYLDDIVVVGGTILLLKTLTNRLYGQKSNSVKWTGIIIIAAVVAFIIFYVFWGADLIPDSVPIFGRMDDLAAVITGVNVLVKWKYPGEPK